MASLHAFLDLWRQRLCESHLDRRDELAGYPTDSQVDSLITSSCAHSFQVGTGASIYTNSLLPALASAQYEVILVTCFWASSSSLTALRDTLEQLARERQRLVAEHGPDGDIQPLRIRICFSSRSLFQKLFHTSSEDGYIYPPDTWPSLLNLPPQELLRAGAIDLQVKSLFFLPFSVMHPKFLIVDRQRAWLPSCNVSWESWFEGCLEVSGDVVTRLVEFYQRVWDRDLDLASPTGPRPSSGLPPSQHVSLHSLGLASIQSPASHASPLAEEIIPTILLPSSHHRNPRFRLLPWSSNPPPPCTPLNVALTRLLEMAERSIYIQTPNLTSAAVIDGILDALARGVDITIVTGKGMMLLEQVVTAGTTTSLCIRSLVNRYKSMLESGDGAFASRRNGTAANSAPLVDLEAAVPRAGCLKISYFHGDKNNLSQNVSEEPVHSHLKLTIVDGQYTVLGSGNMDRASWFTSQELGILLYSSKFAQTVTDTVLAALRERTDIVFDASQPR